jgi:hypothetical protein
MLDPERIARLPAGWCFGMAAGVTCGFVPSYGATLTDNILVIEPPNRSC